MNKELSPLKALETVKQWYSVEKVNTLKPYQWKQIRDLLPNECEIIETALKRLEEIDNAMFLNNKQLKALEIIKRKPQTVWLVKICANYETYCESAKLYLLSDDNYTDIEYELLKEMLQ